MFTQDELQTWNDQKQNDWKPIKKHKDPRKEKRKDFRKGIRSTHFNKESTAVRKEDYRKYRTQMKRLMYKEQYELLRDYQRTSGWLTW